MEKYFYMNPNEYLRGQLQSWAETNPFVPSEYRDFGSPDEIGLFKGLASKGTRLQFAIGDTSFYSAVAFDPTDKVSGTRMQGPDHSVDMVALHEDARQVEGVLWPKFFLDFSKRTRSSAPVRYGRVEFSGIILPETGLFICSPREEQKLALDALTFVAARNPRPVPRVSDEGWPLSDVTY